MGLAVWSPGAGHGARRSGAETRGSPPWVTPLGFPQGLARSWPAASTHPEGRWGGGVLPSGSEPLRLFPSLLGFSPPASEGSPKAAEPAAGGAERSRSRAALPAVRVPAGRCPPREPPESRSRAGTADGSGRALPVSPPRLPEASPSAPPVAGPLRAAPAPAASPPRWRRLAPSCAGGGWDFRRVGIKTRGKGKGRAAPSAPRCTCCPTGGVPPGNGAPSPRLWPGA